MTARRIAAGALGLGGLAVGLVLLAQEVGPLAGPDREASVPDATAAVLDTVSVRARHVVVSLTGRVVEVPSDTEAVLAVTDGTVPLRFETAHGLSVEDRLLAVGRLRAREGKRRVDVASWSRVGSVARPPAARGLQPFRGG